MTIEWRYTTRQDLGVLSLAGYLGADATDRPHLPPRRGRVQHQAGQGLLLRTELRKKA
ncbi:hypothetical protein [Streptomyces sp. NPDC059072]|uniref:hypothetical protein n=1 Tax=unclassified Streptomyces TaxID=2593676 RepID=UPI0036B4CAC9